MRIASFNLESFGEDGFDAATLAPRLDRLRPILQRIDADVLCLQEVNAQRRPGTARGWQALDALLETTPYSDFHRAFSGGAQPSERHNLAVFSRFPVDGIHDIRHQFVAPPRWDARLAEPAQSPEVTFDRPILALRIQLPQASLHLFSVHLRAPIAAPVAGQKLSASRWKSVAGWAEGYFIAAMKRTGQALELRQAVDAIFDREPRPLIAAVGDFNAVEVESALRIVVADPDDTGNAELQQRRLVSVETSLPPARRYTVRHAGRPHMLDHILVSLALAGRLKSVEVFNRDLADEVAAAGSDAALGSFHAPLLADFDL